MPEKDLAPPHVERLVRRLRVLEEPLIQIWGWPGTGRAALLEALLTAEGERAMALSRGDLCGERELKRAVETARINRVRFLVASACSDEQAAAAARWLIPGVHLVFATERRTGLPAGAVVSPQELLLESSEVATLCHLLTGSLPDGRAAEELRAASDGWYLPLRLALEATGGAGLSPCGSGGISGPGEETLLEVPAVRSFLRHQFLASLTEGEREMLLAVDPYSESWMSGDGRPAAWRTLIESRGLWIEAPDGERPPRLLAAYLARQRRRRPGRVPVPVPEVESPVENDGVPVEGAMEAEPGFVFRLGLLGDPFVRQVGALGENSERELEWRLRRSFQVLAFLASSPGLQAGREDLIEAIWPREGEQTIDRNFHPTLSHLRRSLEGDRRGGVPPPLLFRAGVYRLNPEIRWEIDLLEFRRLIEEGRSAAEGEEREAATVAWQRAWKLYRGPFLQGYYDAWVSTRRESYHRFYLDLLRDLGDLYVRLGRPDAAMDAYRSILVEDPLQERIHIAVMRLYAGQGRRDLVRRQYDKLCTLLLEELGVEPLPETTQEYHRLISSGTT